LKDGKEVNAVMLVGRHSYNTWRQYTFT